MKINFNEVDYKEMYKVGNVIRNSDNMLFLVAEGNEYGYVLVNLSKNMVTRAYETLEELSEKFGEEDDTLANVEVNVLWGENMTSKILDIIMWITLTDLVIKLALSKESISDRIIALMLICIFLTLDKISKKLR